MSKIALITDTHFGVKNDSQQILDYMQNFYEHIFIPTLTQNNIKHLIMLGDTFDKRKIINFNTLKRSKEMLFDKLLEHGIETHIIVGNHDAYYKNTNEINSVETCLEDYDNIKLYSKPEVINVAGLDIQMMGWICDNNYEESMQALQNPSGVKVCMGHFEIGGFSMYQGVEMRDKGLKQELFKNFQMVLSGHYHHRSTIGNITYLGNICEINWHDYNDPRGFHILDTDAIELQFIENSYTLHRKYTWDNGHEPIYKDQIENKNIKVVVVNKDDVNAFNNFIKGIQESGPLDLKIIEDMTAFEESVIDDDIKIEDTPKIIESYVNNLEDVEKKEEINAYIKGIYIEALNVE